jgi:ribosomal protein S2
VLGGIAAINGAPVVIVSLVDIIMKSHCIIEAKRLNITTFGMVDTTLRDPNKVEFW